MPLLDPSQFDPTTYQGSGAVPAWLAAAAQAPVGMLSATAGASPAPEIVGSGAGTGDVGPVGPTGTPGASGAQPAVPGSSFLGRLQQYLGNNSNMLLRMGAGMAGAPAFGVGLSRGLAGAATGQQEDIARQMMLGGVQASYTALIKAGASPQEALAAVYNPAIMAQVQKKYFPSGATTYAGGQGYDAAGRPISTATPGQITQITDPTGRLLPTTGMQTGGQVQTLSPTALPQAPPPQAIATLKANPSFAGEFDRKYGPGSAARYLGQ